MRVIKSVEEMQSRQISIMKYIHEFCVESDIKYFLAYGSLIGAIRHHGFIPWDDDIDICMLRADYDRFLKYFPAWGKEKGLYLASSTSKEHFYPHTLAKVCDSNTVLIEKMLKINPELGIYVDVFCLDGIPDNTINKWILIKYGRLLKRLLVASNMDASSNAFLSHYNITKRLIIKSLNWIHPERVFRTLEEHSKRYKEKNTKEIMNLETSKPIVYKREWFEGVILQKFEDEEFYIPVDYDPILRIEYGDYMQLPPKEKQIPHHVIDVWEKE